LKGIKYYIGTSGYSYQHWKNGVFYPRGLKDRQWLEYYASRFNTVELNVTFYRIPNSRVFQTWYERTPDDFKFVVKGTRIITHLKKLTNYENTLKNFLDVCSRLKKKLILILWQFPPGFKYQDEKFNNFLNLLSRTKYLYAFEFRHETWFNSQVYTLLKKFNYSLCIADSPHWPCVEEITSDYLYLRFHGGRILYGSEYSLQELKSWAGKVKNWISKYKIKTVFAYFNNDAYGFAVKNALTFRELLVK
jgi:uncharacterized protein YecE (DUF72 family)